jgi:dTDP-4-dehydrorhamnose reductase
VILRTAWVHAAHGHNFVRTMLKHGAQKEQLKVVGDQIGGPTAADDIAAALVTIAGRIAGGAAAFGTHHFCGAPAASWYDFAQAVFDRAEPVWGRRPAVERITSDQWPTPVTRPANSVLDCTGLTEAYGIEQPDWQTRLSAIVARLLAGGAG